eukprot:jgi/Mesen1/10674/ME000009S10466
MPASPALFFAHSVLASSNKPLAGIALKLYQDSYGIFHSKTCSRSLIAVGIPSKESLVIWTIHTNTDDRSQEQPASYCTWSSGHKLNKHSAGRPLSGIFGRSSSSSSAYHSSPPFPLLGRHSRSPRQHLCSSTICRALGSRLASSALGLRVNPGAVSLSRGVQAFAGPTALQFAPQQGGTCSSSQEERKMEVVCEDEPRQGLEVKEIVELTEIEQRIFSTLMETVRENKLKTQLRVAGGWVRDKLLGRDCYDIDIALDDVMGREFAEKVHAHLVGRGEEVREAHIIQCNPEQSKHLETATMNVHGMSIDFVNLRAETYAESSRIPVVEFGSASDDAMRRDLTINSLFYNINTGSVEDLTGQGKHRRLSPLRSALPRLADLRAGIIQTPLPSQQTFLDDPLRVLRAVRFVGVFDTPGPPWLSHVQLMLKGADPLGAMRLLSDLQLFPVVFALPANASPPISYDYGRQCVASMAEAMAVMAQFPASRPEEGDMVPLYLAAMLLPLRHVTFADKKGKQLGLTVGSSLEGPQLGRCHRLDVPGGVTDVRTWMRTLLRTVVPLPLARPPRSCQVDRAAAKAAAGAGAVGGASGTLLCSASIALLSLPSKGIWAPESARSAVSGPALNGPKAAVAWWHALRLPEPMLRHVHVAALHEGADEWRATLDPLLSARLPQVAGAEGGASAGAGDDLTTPDATLRITAGTLIRKGRRLWRQALLLASLLDLPCTQPLLQTAPPAPTTEPANAAAVPVSAPGDDLHGAREGGGEGDELSRKRKREAAAASMAEKCRNVEAIVARLGLERAWEMKPLLDGKSLIKLLALKGGGPQIGHWMERAMAWQLANPRASKEACAEWLKQEHARGENEERVGG